MQPRKEKNDFSKTQLNFVLFCQFIDVQCWKLFISMHNRTVQNEKAFVLSKR